MLHLVLAIDLQLFSAQDSQRQLCMLLYLTVIAERLVFLNLLNHLLAHADFIITTIPACGHMQELLL